MFALIALVITALSIVRAAPITIQRDLSVIEGVHVGQATYFYPDVGACGIKNNENEMIAAVTMGVFDQYPGATGNPVLSVKVTTNGDVAATDPVTKQKKSLQVKVTDRCQTPVDCEAPFTYNIDLTPAAFKILAPLDVGRLDNVTWWFVKHKGA